MHTLPDLPFPKDSTPNFCSAETFDFHHNKHHAGYVKKLNAAVENTDLANKNLEEIILESHKENNLGVFNNAAQHWNHNFFWNSISSNGGAEPGEKLKELLDRDFGSVESFKEQFSGLAAKLFGSGWVWLVQNSEGKLEILPMPNAGTPVTEGKTALLTLDVWEHAYYIDHRNARAKYIEEYWNVVNWKNAEELLA